MKKQLKTGDWLVRLPNGNVAKCANESEADVVLGMGSEVAATEPPIGSMCALALVVCIAVGYLLGAM